MIATRSQTSSISLSRCELRRTATPRVRRSSSSRRTVRRPAGSSALVGLVEEQELRGADQRLGDSEPLLHPLGHRVDRAIGGILEADEPKELGAFLTAAVAVGEPLVEG